MGGLDLEVWIRLGFEWSQWLRSLDCVQKTHWFIQFLFL